MSEPYLVLSWRAQRDLRQLETGTGKEIGGGLIGRVEGRRIVVDRIIPNPCGPYSADETPVDFAFLVSFEEPPGCNRDERRVVGSIHSHEIYEPGGPIASEADLDHVRHLAARIPGQIAYAALIVGPGFHGDWQRMRMRAWCAYGAGEVWVANIVSQPRWLAEAEAQIKFPPRRSYAP